MGAGIGGAFRQGINRAVLGKTKPVKPTNPNTPAPITQNTTSATAPKQPNQSLTSKYGPALGTAAVGGAGGYMMADDDHKGTGAFMGALGGGIAGAGNAKRMRGFFSNKAAKPVSSTAPKPNVGSGAGVNSGTPGVKGTGNSNVFDLASFKMPDDPKLQAEAIRELVSKHGVNARAIKKQFGVSNDAINIALGNRVSKVAGFRSMLIPPGGPIFDYQRRAYEHEIANGMTPQDIQESSSWGVGTGVGASGLLGLKYGLKGAVAGGIGGAIVGTALGGAYSKHMRNKYASEAYPPDMYSSGMTPEEASEMNRAIIDGLQYSDGVNRSIAPYVYTGIGGSIGGAGGVVATHLLRNNATSRARILGGIAGAALGSGIGYGIGNYRGAY